MAKIIRIWDVTAQDYVEHDVTVVDMVTVGIPVTPVSVSQTVTQGVVNKIINTEDIITSDTVVSLDRSSSQIEVIQGSTTLSTINPAAATPITIDRTSTTTNVTVSNVGQTGARGRDAATAFESFGYYPKGSLAVSAGKLWEAKVELDGSVVPLAEPDENQLWTEVATESSIFNSNLTSGYEISTLADWVAIRDTLKFGDLVKAPQNMVLFFDEDTPEFVVGEGSGFPLLAADGVPFEVQSFSTGTNEQPVIGSSELMTILPSLLTEGVVERLEEQIRGRSSSFQAGSDITPGGDGVTARNNATKLFTGNGAFYSVRTFATGGAGGALRVYTFDTSPTFEFSGTGAQLFGVNPPGLKRSGEHFDLTAGDTLFTQRADGTVVSQEIEGVRIVGGDTFYIVEDFTEFPVGTLVSPRIETFQEITGNLWYARNESVSRDELRLDLLADNPSANAEIVSSQGRISSLEDYRDNTTTTSDPGLVTKNQRDSLIGFADNPAFSSARLRQVQTAMSRLLGNPTLGTTISTVGSVTAIEIGAQVNVQTDWNVMEDRCFLSTTSNGITTNDPRDQFITQGSCETAGRCTWTNSSGKRTEDNVTDSECTALFNSDGDPALRGDLKFVNYSWLDNRDSDALILNRPDTSSIGGLANGGALLELDSSGRISATAFGQVNLGSTEVYTNTTSRNLSTDRAWQQGDVAIIAGIAGLALFDPDPFVAGGTELRLVETDSLPSTGDIVLINGSDTKTISFTANDTNTDTLTVDSSTFSADDVTTYPAVSTAVSVITGTFAYQGNDQSTPEITEDINWVEIATPTGTVTSVSGKVGVVSLAQSDIDGLTGRLTAIESVSQTNTEGVASNDDDIGILGSAGIQGVFEFDSGITYTETAPGTGVYQDTNGNDFTGTIPDTFTTDPVDPILSTGIRSNLEDLDTRVSSKVDKDGTMLRCYLIKTLQQIYPLS